MDQKTDKAIQQMVKRELRGKTLLTIAHRLQTIITYDKILVLSDGKVVEFDTPAALLGKGCGHFYDMVETLGKRESEKLNELARLGKQAAPALVLRETSI